MADKLVDFIFGAGDVEQKKDPYSIAPGIVENNVDLLSPSSRLSPPFWLVSAVTNNTSH